MPVEDDLRRQIAGLMATRQEQSVLFAADDGLPLLIAAVSTRKNKVPGPKSRHSASISCYLF
jgi:hypothetical protein